jgi:hypothetical protein
MRDTIDMARESWIDVYGLGHDRAKFIDALKHFESLVRADERNELYKIVMDAPFRQNVETEENGEDLLFVLKVMAFDINSAIRARGNT